MPITFGCVCGRHLQIADEYAGKQARCPDCGAVLDVPPADAPPPLPPPAPLIARPVKQAALDEPAETDDDHAAGAASLNPADRRNRPSGRSRRDAGDDDRPRCRRYDDGDDEDDDRPRREPPPHKLLNTRVTGGITTIVLAVIIFGIGLALDRICFWPIIMLVIGVVSLIHGLITGRDE